MRLDKDVVQWSDAQQARYSASLRNAAGASETPFAIIEEIAAKFSASLAGDTTGSIADEIIEKAAVHESCTLIGAALVSIRLQHWQTAKDLLAAIDQGDRQDLVVQRLSGAVEHQSEDLVLPLDKWLKDRFCSRPFSQIDTQPNQHVHFCPAAWQPVPIGTLSDDPDLVWNGSAAQEIRRSVLEGEFSHCSRRHCPHIAHRRLPSRTQILASNDQSAAMAGYRKIIRNGTTCLDKPPERANLSHDLSCNISCPSCRTKALALKKYDADRLDKTVNENYARFLSASVQVTVSREGEPFASRHFLNFLKLFCSLNERRKVLDLHTNGLLLTESVWNRLDLWGHVASVHVSVDAATPGTYEKLRRGGQFARLIPNLHFLGHLRRMRIIDAFRLAFVVQRDNYTEMPDFVRLSRLVGANGVLFQRLRDRGTFGEDPIAERDIADPGHPEHERFRLILEDPVLQAREVDTGELVPAPEQPETAPEQGARGVPGPAALG